MKKLRSNIPFNYITIKTTKSRITKGLLAIPVSLIDLFPKSATKIYLVNQKGIEETKKFTPYQSSSHECRIGGLKKFYETYQVMDGDELVIQMLEDGKYKLVPERIFVKQVNGLEKLFEKSENQADTEKQIDFIASVTNSSKVDVLKNEFVRLSNKDIKERKTKISQLLKLRENAPSSLRKILLCLYNGKCQVSGFTFLMKNKNPYFEIHHINPIKGNHLKNLLVVSPNVHAQFTFANLEQYFDAEGWLRKISFNEKVFPVYQVIDKLPKIFEKEVHY